MSFVINPYRFGAGGGGFTDPTDIAGCQLWLDAEQGVYSDAGTTLATNNDTVQQWNDQSGNGNHVSQATGGNRPTFKTAGINSKDSVEFADPSFMDSATPVVAAPNTVFAVHVMTLSDAFGGVIWDSKANVRHNFYWDDVLNPDFFRSASVNIETTTVGFGSQFDEYITAVTYNGASSSIFMNGADVGDGSVDLGSNALDGITLGTLRAGLGGGNYYLNGQIAEVIVYDSALSTGDRATVETYLSNKWGITI